jgi:hypothetical protein
MVHIVRLLRLLLLVGRCPLDPADRRDRAQEPHELDVLRAVTLDEERALLLVEAQREEGRGHLSRLAAQGVRVVEARQRVVVDDAVDRLELLLERHVVADGAEVVAEMDDPGRLDAAEDPLAGDRVGGRGGTCIDLGRHGSRV